MKKTLVLAVSAIAFVATSAIAADATTTTAAEASATAPAAAPATTHAKAKHHHKKAVHKAHVAKKGDASPEESTTK